MKIIGRNFRYFLKVILIVNMFVFVVHYNAALFFSNVESGNVRIPEVLERLIRVQPKETDFFGKGVYGARIQLLRNQCRRLRMRKPEHGRILVDPMHQLMYCQVEKVGSSNWLRAFLILAGEFAPDEVIMWGDFYKLYNHYKKLSQYKYQERTQLLRNYTKFLFVRHPFTRVLSAFRNKIVDNPDIEFALSMVTKIQKVTGSNATLPQFNDFVQYLISTDEDPREWNLHFRPIYDLCSPCEIKYNFVGHLETIEQDAKAILTKIGATFPFPNFSEGNTNSSNHDNIRKYYKTVTKEQIEGLYKIYENDFRLFGYTTDQFVYIT